MELLMADFETTTDPLDVRVWGSCIVDVDSFKVKLVGNSIDDFFNYIDCRTCHVWFHNLKFDGEFIISWLLKNGWVHNDSKLPKSFDTIITDDGQFYQLKLYHKKYKSKNVITTIQDSYKKLPFPVKNIAKMFELAECKLEIDYKEYREIGHVLTDLEREYIVADCMIVAKALNHQFSQDLTKMTIGADALNGFKNVISKKSFKAWYPVLDLEVDNDIRRAYKGGYTYLNPCNRDKRLQGCVFDVNSLYPSVMYNQPLPFGKPLPFDGEYEYDAYYPLYIQRLRCSFKVKPGHLPTIQLKNNKSYVTTEYLTTTDGKIEELTLTSVDLVLFKEHYEILNLEYICGWMFKSSTGIFCAYIDYWMNIKATSTGGLRTLAKLMLNSLYGKFATNPISIMRIPYLDEDGIVRYYKSDIEYRDPVYTAVGCFVTSYARCQTISAAQSVYDRFIYCDTDSIHLIGFDIPINIEVHPTQLGAWKHEGDFTDSKFLRAKTYLETIDDKLHVTCAGMPDNLKELVTFDNFTYGTVFSGKLMPKRYEGGIVLIDVDFTIKAMV